MVFMVGATVATGGAAGVATAIGTVGGAATAAGPAGVGVAVASGVGTTVAAGGASAAATAGGAAAYGGAAAACAAAGPGGWVALGLFGADVKAGARGSTQEHILSDIEFATADVFQSMAKAGIMTADCWKPILHTEDDESSEGYLGARLLQHPSVASFDVHDSHAFITNIWSETFVAYPVVLPGKTPLLAIHAERLD